MTGPPTPPPLRRGLSKSFRATGAVAAFVTSLAAVVNDVLVPARPYALLLAGAAALLFVVVALVKPLAPRLHALGETHITTDWQQPVLVTLGVSVVLLLGAQLLTRSATSGGWLASHVSSVRELQSTLGIVDDRTRAIDATTQSIKRDTEQINAKLDNVKKENSSDPRKELANLGVTWSTQSFVDALMTGDGRVVELFLKGGMSPTVMHGGASAVLYMLQTKLPDPVPMLDLMLAAGFDVNENLYDPKILRHYSDLLPPYFQARGLPDDYQAGVFAGPALLWLVIRSSAGVTEDWDARVITFLRSHGADTSLSKEFLRVAGSQYGWDEFTGYQTARAALG